MLKAPTTPAPTSAPAPVADSALRRSEPETGDGHVDIGPTLSPTRTRVLMLCADDFGLDTGISVAIARLARAGRLNAISCVTNTEAWSADSAWLSGLPGEVGLGLHFNLTQGRPLSRRLAKVWPTLPTYPRLAALAHLGLLPRAELRAEFHAQFGAFVKALEKPPGFIDGHQHVHQLPVVRNIILDAVEHIQPMPALRSTTPLHGSSPRLTRWVLAQAGGLGLARELRRRVIPHNRALLGVYDFQRGDFRALMQGWLASLPPEGGLMLCHPGGVSSTGLRDPIGAARIRELNYLSSDDFALDLAVANVTLGSAWR